MSTWPPISSLVGEPARVEERYRTFRRVTTTPYPIAQTPKQVVWTLNKAKLYRYIPVVAPEQRHREPLLLVFALMNRPSILDLRPGHSFVGYMLHKGYDVYLMDWGAPGPEDKNLKLDDYVLEYLVRAIRKLKSLSRTDTFNLLGWCIGAILTTCYGALCPEDGLHNLILLTAPLDFTNKQAGGFVGWVNDKYFDVDKVLARFGNMPGELIDYGAKALKPVDNYLTNYVRLWDNLDNPRVVESWHALNTWVRDLIPMAGGFYRNLIKDLYNENRLMNGTLVVRGERVDLRRLRANLLNVIASDDHIAPPCQSESIMARAGSDDKQLLRLPGGHIGLMAGSGAVKTTWPQIEAWLAARSA